MSKDLTFELHSISLPHAPFTTRRRPRFASRSSWARQRKNADRMLSPVVVTVSAASIVVHADAPNYRPPSTTVSKKECDERKHAKAMREWQSGAHQLGGAAGVAGGAAMGLEDESSDGGGGVATVFPGRRRSALSGSLWQQAAAEGAAAAAGTPPVRMVSSHGLALSDSLRFLRGQLREFLRECAAADVELIILIEICG